IEMRIVLQHRHRCLHRVQRRAAVAQYRAARLKRSGKPRARSSILGGGQIVARHAAGAAMQNDRPGGVDIRHSNDLAQQMRAEYGTATGRIGWPISRRAIRVDEHLYTVTACAYRSVMSSVRP